MKTKIALFSLIVILIPMVANAAPSERTAKTDVTGTIVDFDHGLLILKDFTGWDRNQTEYALRKLRKEKRTIEWLKSFDNTHAVIWIKSADVKQIQKGKSTRVLKGARVTIEGYSYFTDEWDIYPDYQRFTVTKDAEQRADGKPAKPKK